MNNDVVAALHPPRLPEAFTAAGPADYLLAFGLGLALAALVVWLFAPALRRRPRPLPLRKALSEASALPSGEAMLRLAALAEARGVTLKPEETAALYARDPGPEAEALATRLAEAAR